MWADFESLRLSGIQTGVFAAAYYAAMIIASDKINFKKTAKILTVSVLSFVFLEGTVIMNIPSYNRASLLMFESNGGSYLLIKNGSESVLVADGGSLNSYTLAAAEDKAGANGISAAVITGANGYTCVKNIQSAAKTDRFYISAEYAEDISEYFREGEIINSDSFTVGKIDFDFIGESSLRIRAAGAAILLDFGGGNGDLVGIFDIIISDSYNENIENYYSEDSTFFYAETEGYPDSSEESLLLSINNGKIKVSF